MAKPENKAPLRESMQKMFEDRNPAFRPEATEMPAGADTAGFTTHLVDRDERRVQAFGHHHEDQQESDGFQTLHPSEKKHTGPLSSDEEIREMKLTADSAVSTHPIGAVFEAVHHQLTGGKGERHGGGRTPFLEQQWVDLARVHGLGFLTGQAQKKLTEAMVSGNREQSPEAFRRELLGAIAYLSMAVITLDRHLTAK